MNHRRALRASTDASLAFFAVMTAGVVLWTTDEVLQWDLLPDWIGRYAQLIVIVLSILAVSAVVASIISSFAVMAESAAKMSGLAEIAPSPRSRVLVAVAFAAVLGGMFGLHEINQYRDAHLRQEERAKERARHRLVQTELRARLPAIVSLFSADTKAYLAAGPIIGPGDQEVARLLQAVRASTQYSPSATVMLRAQAPYRHCVISNGTQYTGATPTLLLNRQYLTDLPSEWERNAIATIFEGRAPRVPADSPGAFLDTTRPSAWGTLQMDGRVVGILMLSAD